MSEHPPSEATAAAPRLSDVDGVAVITLDDGKANALGYDALRGLGAALDDAADAKALVVMGRPGKFSAGFDLAVMRDGPAAAADLMAEGAEIALRLFEWPHPTVLGVTGHALAMGAVLLCCGDVRVGAEGDFKIGLNEVAIGLAMPVFALELARARLANRALNDAVALARIYSPAEAATMGWLDEVVAPEAVLERCVTRAGELGDGLDARAFAKTRATMRSALAAELRASLGPALREVSA